MMEGEFWDGRNFIADIHNCASGCPDVIFRVYRLAAKAAEKGQGREQQGDNAHAEGKAHRVS